MMACLLCRMVQLHTHSLTIVSDIAIFVLKRDVKLQLTNSLTYHVFARVFGGTLNPTHSLTRLPECPSVVGPP